MPIDPIIIDDADNFHLREKQPSSKALSSTENDKIMSKGSEICSAVRIWRIEAVAQTINLQGSDSNFGFKQRIHDGGKDWQTKHAIIAITHYLQLLLNPTHAVWSPHKSILTNWLVSQMHESTWLHR